MTMLLTLSRRSALLLAISSALATRLPSQSNARTSAKVDTFDLTSRAFKNTRKVRVFTPAGYGDAANAGRRYPVFYINDGELAFEPTALNIAAVVSKLIVDGSIVPIIVVGIDNAASGLPASDPNRDNARESEYIPYPDVGIAPNHIVTPDVADPKGALYPSFLFDEVIPLVTSRYRTSTNPTDIAVGGMSYGAVAALYASLHRPGAIGRLYLESASLNVGADDRLLKEALSATVWPARVYIGVGTAELPVDSVENRSIVDRYEGALTRYLKERVPQTQLTFSIERGARHTPVAWRRRLPAALIALFGAQNK